MCFHVCEDTCSNVLITSFGNFKLFVVLTHSKQQTEHLFLFCLDINVKLKSFLSGKLVLRFVLVCN